MEEVRLHIDESLVLRLIADRFPEWAGLPVARVEPGGWDNRTFRLGETMSVRMPSARRYAAQAAKEFRWLPWLAPQLPLAVQTPLALGEPTSEYPWNWSVCTWIEGEAATSDRIGDIGSFATTLAEFLRALWRIDPAGGPPPGPHNFFRGDHPGFYDAQTRSAITELEGRIDTATATAVWEAAPSSRRRGSPVWLHGDVAASNLLVSGGRLNAVIDFGGAGVGDPACDLAIAWTLFSGRSRERFRETLATDSGTWARGRGRAPWKALITLAGNEQSDPIAAMESTRIIDEILVEFESAR